MFNFNWFQSKLHTTTKPNSNQPFSAKIEFHIFFLAHIRIIPNKNNQYQRHSFLYYQCFTCNLHMFCKICLMIASFEDRLLWSLPSSWIKIRIKVTTHTFLNSSDANLTTETEQQEESNMSSSIISESRNFNM